METETQTRRIAYGGKDSPKSMVVTCGLVGRAGTGKHKGPNNYEILKDDEVIWRGDYVQVWDYLVAEHGLELVDFAPEIQSGQMSVCEWITGKKNYPFD